MNHPKINLAALYISLVVNLVLTVVVTVKMQRSPTDVYRAVVDLASKTESSVVEIANNQRYILDELHDRGEWMAKTDENLENLQTVVVGIVKRENEISLDDLRTMLETIDAKIDN